MNGRAVAKALQMVAEGVGDIAPKIVDEVPGAARKALDDIAGAVDDWGWKGGKPGEITGGDVQRAARGVEREAALRAFRNQLENHAATSADGVSKNFTFLDEMFPKSPHLDEASANIAEDFAALERAGIPREWTGKVLGALYDFGRSRWKSPGLNLRRVGDTRYNGGIFGPGGVTGIADPAEAVSNAMRGMYVKGNPELTKQYRETFLSLLPEWEGSLDDLANAARML